MKIIHSFVNYDREPTVVILRRWRGKKKNRLSGLYEPSVRDEEAKISINEDLLNNDEELLRTIIHELAHCYFNTAYETKILEFEYKVIKLFKKLGFKIIRDKTFPKVIKSV